MSPEELLDLADRIEMMPLPPRIPFSKVLIPVSAAHTDGYAEGHHDGVRRVAYMLRRMAKGQGDPDGLVEAVMAL